MTATLQVKGLINVFIIKNVFHVYWIHFVHSKLKTNFCQGVTLWVLQGEIKY